MAAKFDAESFARLAAELQSYRDGGKKPNGILSQCIAGIESFVGKDPHEFGVNTPEHKKTAVREAVQGASTMNMKIATDPHLFSAIRQENNGLRAVQQGKTHVLDQAIRFAEEMTKQLGKL